MNYPVDLRGAIEQRVEVLSGRQTMPVNKRSCKMRRCYHPYSQVGRQYLLLGMLNEECELIEITAPLAPAIIQGKGAITSTSAIWGKVYVPGTAQSCTHQHTQRMRERGGKEQLGLQCLLQSLPHSVLQRLGVGVLRLCAARDQ
jgi:hypothetical protein